MEHLAKLLAPIPLPDPPSGVDASALPPAIDGAVVHDLGADLPAGHLHVWGGPPGAGKTSFLLSLLYGAALGGRRAVYATYDLPASTLALRLLAMLADVQTEALPEDSRGSSRMGAPPAVASAVASAEGPVLTREQARRASTLRAALEPLPFWLLESRGFSAGSLGDRLVRMPYRPDVVVVDYLQAVIREPGSELGTALKDLSDMAARLHLAVLCVFRSDPGERDTDAVVDTSKRDASKSDASKRVEHSDAVLSAQLGAASSRESASAARSASAQSAEAESLADLADRVGWIAPAEGSGARRAQILANRYGERPSMPLQFDPATGRLVPRVHG